MTAGALRVGTAGWSVATRYAESFPGPGSHLERYARVLDAAEINSSFYRPHRRTTYERWAAGVPDGFRFAAKLPRTVTHERRLVDCAEPLDRFLGEVAGLGPKLAVLLVQLPPSLGFEPEVAEAFFQDLTARGGVAIACEPRHATWFDGSADALLAEWSVARVAADPPRAPGADAPGGTDGLVYYRLHGSPRVYHSDYDSAFLATLKPRLEAHRAKGADTWCIFDNTVASAALGNALAIS